MNPFVIAFRRIIYSIPLKRLLVGLAVFAVLFASFSSAEDVEDLIVYSNNFSQVQIGSSFTSVVKLNGTHEVKSCCVKFTNYNHENLIIGFSMSPNGVPNRTFEYANNGVYVCLDYYADGYLVAHSDRTITINGDVFVLNDLLTTPIPKLTSLECQTEYNLIPISSVDEEYCSTNNLCPSSSPSDCPNVGVSNLYINDIFHPGAFNIFMNIPEEIDWDYAYTNSGQNFNFNVFGYNQDFEKIEGWIETNNYKPSSDDFTNLFTGGFSKFGGLLIASLFVILVFYFVKKMFK